MRKRWVALGLLLAAALAAQAKPPVCCADAGPEGFDPSLWDSASTGNVTAQIFNGLVGFVRGSTQLRPELATVRQISPDAKTFTFTLRRGVRALYREAQVVFKRERPWITLAHSSIHIPVRKGVRGFVMAPNGSIDLEGVYRQ